MIKVTVKQAARERGIQNAYQLAQRLEGLNGKKPSAVARQLAKRLWDGERLPRLDSIDAVAAAFGDCALSELLHRVPERRARRPKRAAVKQQSNGLAYKR